MPHIVQLGLARDPWESPLVFPVAACDELAEEERGLGGSCRLGGPRRLGVSRPVGFASGGLGTL